MGDPIALTRGDDEEYDIVLTTEETGNPPLVLENVTVWFTIKSAWMNDNPSYDLDDSRAVAQTWYYHDGVSASSSNMFIPDGYDATDGRLVAVIPRSMTTLAPTKTDLIYDVQVKIGAVNKVKTWVTGAVNVSLDVTRRDNVA